jgi:phage baseplate assembly protein W
MAYKNLVIKPPKYPNADGIKEAQFYRGFSTVNDTTSVNLYDNDLVKQDILNQFSTKKGERLMNPEFGTIIWDLIFDPLTEILKEQIKDDVSAILTSDPRIAPMDVIIDEKDYGLLIEVTVLYVFTDQTENMKLTFDREIGLSVV